MWKFKRKLKNDKNYKYKVSIAVLLVIVLLAMVAVPTVNTVYAKEVHVLETVRVDVYTGIDKSISTTYHNGDDTATAAWMLQQVQKTLTNEGLTLTDEESIAFTKAVAPMLKDLYRSGEVVANTSGILSDSCKAYMANIAASALIQISPELARTKVPTNESMMIANVLANSAALQQMIEDSNQIIKDFNSSSSIEGGANGNAYEILIKSMRNEIDALRTVVMSINADGTSGNSTLTQEQINALMQGGAGANGANGANGSGTSGSDGAEGSSGSDGASGSNGSNGTNGSGISNNTFTQYEAQVAQKFETINQLQTKIENIIKQMEQNSTTNVTKISGDIQNIKADIINIHKTTEELEGKISDNAKEILVIKEGIQNNIQLIEENKSIFDKFVSEYNTFIDGLQDDLTGIRDSIAENADAIEDTNDDLADMGNEINDKIDTSNQDLTSKLEESNNSLNSKLDDTNSSLNSKIDETNSALSGRLDETNTSLTDKINTSNSELKNALETADKNTNDKMDAADKEIHDKIDSNNTEITDKLQDAKDQLGKDITNTNKTLESYNKALGDRLIALETSLMTTVINDVTVAPAIPYNPSTSYGPGDCVLQDGKLYMAIMSTTGTFNPAAWFQLMNGYCWVGSGASYYVDLTHEAFKGAESVEVNYANAPDMNPEYTIDRVTGTLRITVNNPAYTEINHVVIYYKK